MIGPFELRRGFWCILYCKKTRNFEVKTPKLPVLLGESEDVVSTSFID